MVTIKQLICVAILGLTAREAQAGRLRHCYVCRSRGELGDCKDPFDYNVTTVNDVKGVEAVPCASGWCAKIVEGENGDFDTATERICVQRPPTDGEERCAHTVIDRKPVYMCFCLGNLCNGSETIPRLNFSYLILLSLSIIYMNQRFMTLNVIWIS